LNEWEWNLLEDKVGLDHVEIGGVTVRPGDRVRLKPKEGGDILDLALRGQIATVESIEEDYENGQHICVVLDDDPGRDLGMMRQPGHRFFFTPTEVEPIEERGAEETARHRGSSKPTILVAGIGNIFLGDDGFGVEVARLLSGRLPPSAVRVIDFGIRGFDLAYALQDGYETTILVDAYPHGQKPGTVTVIEPNLDDLDRAPGEFVQPHAMNPMNVLRMAKAMNGASKRVLLVGCEPESLGGEEGHMGLSAACEAALEDAVIEIESLVNQIIEETESNRAKSPGEEKDHVSKHV
jgi:hydrogenase maturation protease